MLSLRSLALVLFSPVALTACGVGSVAIELTDAAPVLDDLQSVEITLGRVEVHAYCSCNDGDDAQMAADDERGEWITVNEKVGTVDLLDLQNDVTKPLGEVDVGGKINRIRMHIDAGGTNRVVLKDGQACALAISDVAAGGVDVNEFEAFEPPRGGRSTVIVDFDINASLDQTDACSFVLDPSLRIKRIDAEGE